MLTRRSALMPAVTEREGSSPLVNSSPSCTRVCLGRWPSKRTKECAHTLRKATSMFPPFSEKLG